jgi:hypothetical protein
VLLKNFIPQETDTFAFLLGNHDGRFSIANPNFFDSLFWSVDYEDPTMVTLTVVRRNRAVPDQGSTFLLLTLGLLGLATYQRQLLRKQY